MRDGSFLGGFSWAPHGPVVIADPAVFPSQDTGKENESLILLFVCLSLFLSLSGRESSPQNLPADFPSGALVRPGWPYVYILSTGETGRVRVSVCLQPL